MAVPFDEREQVRNLTTQDTSAISDTDIDSWLADYSAKTSKVRVLLAAADACDFLATQSGEWGSVNTEGTALSNNQWPVRAASYRKRASQLSTFIKVLP